MLLEIKIAIVILAGLIAAYTDYKTGYIYDWLNWPFILIGVILAIFSQNVIWAFAQFGIVFAIGYLAYKFGKIGGGDIKFFAGLVLYFPFFNGYPFILVVLLLASLLATIFYSFYYLIRLLLIKNKLAIKSTYVSLILSFILGLLFFIFINYYFGIIVFIFMFAALFTMLTKTEITNKFWKKKISINKLLDDDLVDMQLLNKEYEKTKTISNIDMFPLEQKTFDKLKKILPKDAKLFVYRNLPIFGPFIALGIILGFIILSFFNIGLLI
jgi:hypothetical protein